MPEFESARDLGKKVILIFKVTFLFWEGFEYTYRIWRIIHLPLKPIPKAAGENLLMIKSLQKIKRV